MTSMPNKGTAVVMAVLWAVCMLSATPSLLAAGDDLRLVEAMQRQDTAAVRALLDEGIDVNIARADGATALAWAAHWNDLATADRLIQSGADPNAANDLSVTPLMLASTNRSAPMVETLLAAGADPNLARPNGETALLLASRAGDVDVVRALLAGGADVTAKTSRGFTSLIFCRRGGTCRGGPCPRRDRRRPERSQRGDHSRRDADSIPLLRRTSPSACARIRHWLSVS